MISIADVPAGHVLMLWPQVRPYIEKTLNRDQIKRYEPPDVLDILLRNNALLWVAWNDETDAPDAAIVTEIVQYPRLRELRVWLIGGKPGTLKTWAYILRDTLEEYAKARGCEVIAGAMRKGWIKIGGPGWKQSGVSLEKRLVGNGQ